MSVNNMSKSHSIYFIQRCHYEGDYPQCIMIDVRSTSVGLTFRDHGMLFTQGTLIPAQAGHKA